MSPASSSAMRTRFSDFDMGATETRYAAECKPAVDLAEVACAVSAA